MIHATVYDETVDSNFTSNLPTDNIPSVFESNSMSQASVYSFAAALASTCSDSKMKISLGSTSTLREDCPLFGKHPNVSATVTSKKGVSANFLSKIWSIKQEEAQQVLKQSTQLCCQGSENPLSRHFSTNDRMLRYKQINSAFFTDTFFVTKVG